MISFTDDDNEASPIDSLTRRLLASSERLGVTLNRYTDAYPDDPRQFCLIWMLVDHAATHFLNHVKACFEELGVQLGRAARFEALALADSWFCLHMLSCEQYDIEGRSGLTDFLHEQITGESLSSESEQTEPSGLMMIYQERFLSYTKAMVAATLGGESVFTMVAKFMAYSGPHDEPISLYPIEDVVAHPLQTSLNEISAMAYTLEIWPFIECVKAMLSSGLRDFRDHTVDQLISHMTAGEHTASQATSLLPDHVTIPSTSTEAEGEQAPEPTPEDIVSGIIEQHDQESCRYRTRWSVRSILTFLLVFLSLWRLLSFPWWGAFALGGGTAFLVFICATYARPTGRWLIEATETFEDCSADNVYKGRVALSKLYELGEVMASDSASSLFYALSECHPEHVIPWSGSGRFPAGGAPVQLEATGANIVSGPSADEIDKVDMRAGNVVTVTDGWTHLRLICRSPDRLLLEYQWGCKRHRFRAIGSRVSRDMAIEAFKAYAAGSDTWQDGFRWQRLGPKAPGRRRRA